MNLQTAKKIAGNQPAYALRNMRYALEIGSVLNTKEQNQRLQAAYTLLRTPHKDRHDTSGGLDDGGVNRIL